MKVQAFHTWHTLGITFPVRIQKSKELSIGTTIVIRDVIYRRWFLIYMQET